MKEAACAFLYVVICVLCLHILSTFKVLTAIFKSQIFACDINCIILENSWCQMSTLILKLDHISSTLSTHFHFTLNLKEFGTHISNVVHFCEFKTEAVQPN